MKTLRFRSNIRCDNCKRAVSTFLDKEEKILSWDVDPCHPEKLLTVRGDITPEAVQAILHKAGYQAGPFV